MQDGHHKLVEHWKIERKHAATFDVDDSTSYHNVTHPNFLAVFISA